MAQDFRGRGWSFPPRFQQQTAGVVMLEQDADIASSLEVLLTTAPGERVMLPQYGCNLQELQFESLNTRLKTLIVDKIRSAILYFEPRIVVEKVQLNDGEQLGGAILIEIIYRVKSTNSRFNFVYPYYLQEGTDINRLTRLQLLPESG